MRAALLLLLLATSACVEPAASLAHAPADHQGTETAPLDWPLQLRSGWSDDAWIDPNRAFRVTRGPEQTLVGLEESGQMRWQRLIAPIDELAFSPSGRLVAVEIADHDIDAPAVEVRDLQTGSLTRRVPLGSSFGHFAIDDDGAVASVWAGRIDATDGRTELYARIVTADGATSEVALLDVLLSAADRRADPIGHWEVGGVALTAGHVGVVVDHSSWIVPDDEMLASASVVRRVVVIDRSNGEPHAYELPQVGDDDPWWSFRRMQLLSPREIALCQDSGCLRVDLLTGARRTIGGSSDVDGEIHHTEACVSGRLQVGRHHVAVRHGDSAWTVWNVASMRRRVVAGCHVALLDRDRILTRDAAGAVVSEADTGRELTRLRGVERIAPHPSGQALAWTETDAYVVTERGFERLGPSFVSLFGEPRPWSAISDDLHTVVAFEQRDERVRIGAFTLLADGARRIWERDARAGVYSAELSPDGMLLAVDLASRSALLSVRDGFRPRTFAPRMDSNLSFTFDSEVVVTNRDERDTSEIIGASGSRIVARSWLRGFRRRLGAERVWLAAGEAYVVDEHERARASLHVVDDGFVVITPRGDFLATPGAERALLRRVDEERVVEVNAADGDPTLFASLFATEGGAAASDLEQ